TVVGTHAMKPADAILDAADSHRLIERLTDGDPSLDEDGAYAIAWDVHARRRERGERAGSARPGSAGLGIHGQLPHPQARALPGGGEDGRSSPRRHPKPASRRREPGGHSSNASTLNGLTASQIVSQAVTQSSGQIAGGILAFLNSAYTVTNAGTVFSGFCACTATFCNGGDFLP